MKQHSVFLCSVCVLVLAFCGFAQDARFKVTGYTTYFDKKTGKEHAHDSILIHVYRGKDKLADLISDKKGKYSISLDFGSVPYKFAVEGNHEFLDESFVVDSKSLATVSVKSPPVIEQKIILLFRDDLDKDSVQYKFPFTKWKFDGSKNFKEDEKYVNEFVSKAFKEYKPALKQVQLQLKEAEATKNKHTRLMLIVGRLLSGTTNKKSLAHIKLNLLDDKGNVVERTETDKLGKFSFSKLNPDQNFMIVPDVLDSAKLSDLNITLLNKFGKKMLATSSDAKGAFKFQLLSSDRAIMAQLEAENNDLLIAGTLEAGLNNQLKVLARKNLVLANPVSGEIYEIVQTDENGKFVFAKISPDKAFVIRLKDEDGELANYTVVIKDQQGVVVASETADGFGKFKFQLLANDKQAMEHLEVDENDLKMDLTGILSDGDKNIPLGNVKVVLLNDKGEVLLSSLTDELGNFLFKNLILYNGYFIQLDAKDEHLSSLKTLVLSDKLGKEIKEYQVELADGIKQRLLASDQTKLARLYLR